MCVVLSCRRRSEASHLAHRRSMSEAGAEEELAVPGSLVLARGHADGPQWPVRASACMRAPFAPSCVADPACSRCRR